MYIWELALHDSVYIQINWTTPHITTAWPLVSIPQLGAGDRPGLIPYVLPEGMPTSLDSHPPPFGFRSQDRSRAHNAELFAFLEKVREADRGASEARANFGLTKTAVSRVIRQHKNASGEPSILAACLATCRASRLQAMTHAIVGTQKPLLCTNTQNTGGNRVYPARNGFVFGSVFKDQRSGRPCFVYAIAPNMFHSTRPPQMGKNFRPGGRTHLAARLSDIERCIFGARLSLTALPEGMDNDDFLNLGRMMWWRPEPAQRVRRPEANHPWHMPPGAILHVYSMVLHHLVEMRTRDHPRPLRCLIYERTSMYKNGNWYMTLVKEGRCYMCSRPLMSYLRDNFSELLDDDGHIDIIVIRDRKSIEEPELTNLSRSHEIYA